MLHGGVSMSSKQLKTGLIFKFVSVIGSVLIIFMAVLYFISIHNVEKGTVQQYEENCDEISDASARRVTLWVDYFANELRVYSESDAVKSGDLQTIRTWLTSGNIPVNPDALEIDFVDTAGNAYDQKGNVFSINDEPETAMMIKDKPEMYVSRALISKITGEAMFLINRSAYDSRKQFIGYLEMLVPLKKMSAGLENIKVGKKGYAFMIDQTGLIMAHQNVDFEMKVNLLEKADKGAAGADSAMQQVAQKMVNGEIGSAWVADGNSSQALIVYHPVEGTPWSLALSIPEDQIHSAADKLKVTLGGLILLVLICTIASTTAFVILELRPLKFVDKAMAGISSGSADLTRRIEIHVHKDEIGSVVNGFNAFVEKLHGIIGDVKNSKDTLASVDSDLQVSTQNTASSITQIIANIDSVGNQITSQSASVEETAGAVNEIASNITSLEKMIENQSSSVTSASAAVEQMIGNIQSVNQSVDKMATSFTALEQNAQTGSSKQQDVNERIEQIESQSEMLQDANTAIANIASQTNLLAMNAAIEAAHAGEAGKGFSVVADEIRKLSETSTTQSKTIGDQLSKIKDSIGAVVSASAESSTAFLSVSAKIKETDELVRQIKAAMEEQQAGSKQITDSLHMMSDSTVEVKTASAEMSAGNAAILEEVKRLQDATSMMKDSMNEMSIGAKKINETGSELAEISGKMRESIKQIGSEIDQFKV